MSKRRSRRLGIVLIAGGCLVTGGLWAAHAGYAYTESTLFCTSQCHTAMAPQAIAHERSVHAAVACVQCHVSNGLGQHVSAKLGGSSRVIKTMLDSYRRPIRSPAEHSGAINAQCKTCHELQNAAAIEPVRTVKPHSSDVTTTPQVIVKVRLTNAAGNADTRGVHWHANSRTRVTYAATDPLRQNIPWVKVYRVDGTETVYSSSNAALAPDQERNLVKHEMGCVDCHNRTGHEITSVLRTLGADAASYPNNLGHWHWPGCFRCHDGQHVSSDGKVLDNDCARACHTVPERARTGNDGQLVTEWHPWPSPAKVLDIAGHRQLLCSDCHRTGANAKRTCDDCHIPN